MKKFYQQSHLIFNFTTVSANFILIGSFVTEKQNFGKDLRLILNDINITHIEISEILYFFYHLLPKLPSFHII